MSVNTLKTNINTLNSDISRLSKQIEDQNKIIERSSSRIKQVRNSINKNTSISSLKTKERSINSEADKINKAEKKITELSEKLAKKKTELQKKQTALDKEQAKLYDDIVKKQDEAIKRQKTMIESATRNKKVDEEKEYDFFISHASEDKEEIAEPLAKYLQSKGARVWFDKFTLSVGDSLRKSIDLGLSNSRYGITILSPDYFKKFWTGEELNGLFSKQEEGEKVILPVWHKISKDLVKKNSPMLADMLALKSSDFTIEELGDEFLKLISEDK